MTDALVIRLNCTASFTSPPPSSLVKMEWTGPGLTKKSMWLYSAPMIREGNNFVLFLAFRPLLVEFAGVYTCEVSYQSPEYHVFSESFTVEGMYVLCNERNKQNNDKMSKYIAKAKLVYILWSHCVDPFIVAPLFPSFLCIASSFIESYIILLVSQTIITQEMYILCLSA